MESSHPIAPETIIRMLEEEGLVEGARDLRPDSDLFAAGLDSMAVMQLIVIVEERYGVIVTPADTGREVLGSPEALAAFITLARTNGA